MIGRSATVEDLMAWGIEHWLPAFAAAQYGMTVDPGRDTLERVVYGMGLFSGIQADTPGFVRDTVRGYLRDACQAVLAGREPPAGSEGNDHRIGILRDITGNAAKAAGLALLGPPPLPGPPARSF